MVSYKIPVIKKMEVMSPILLFPIIILMLMLSISKAFGIKRPSWHFITFAGLRSNSTKLLLKTAAEQ